MKVLDGFLRIIARFWYPVALPEEVVETLGVEVSNFLSFDDLVKILAKSTCNPHRIARYMPRKEVEAAFRNATSRDIFRDKTLITYFFNEGSVEFVLYFDRYDLLRRVYLRHRCIQMEEGVEIPLRSSHVIGHKLTQVLSR